MSDWIAAVSLSATTAESASASENGCIESVNPVFRDELLNREILDSLKPAQALIDTWREHYSAVRPYPALQ